MPEQDSGGNVVEPGTDEQIPDEEDVLRYVSTGEMPEVPNIDEELMREAELGDGVVTPTGEASPAPLPNFQVGGSSASTSVPTAKAKASTIRTRAQKRKAEIQGIQPDRPHPFADLGKEDPAQRAAFNAFMDERIEIPTHLKGNQRKQKSGKTLNYNKSDAVTQRGLDASRKVEWDK